MSTFLLILAFAMPAVAFYFHVRAEYHTRKALAVVRDKDTAVRLATTLKSVRTKAAICYLISTVNIGWNLYLL